MKIKVLLLASISLLLITISCKEKKRTGWVRTQDVPSQPTNNSEQLKWIAETRKVADELYEAGYYMSAYKEYKALSKYVTNDGELYFKRAYCNQQNFGEVEETRADYFMAINLGYKQSASYYGVGLTYLNYKDSLAVFYLEKALSIDPEHEKAQLLLSKLKESSRRGKKYKVTKNEENLLN